jgi:phosphoribosylformylglycinamidine synthase
MGIALTTDCNGRFCYLDPYRGGMHAVAEAARNLSCVGAEPLAVTDCLNFGSPEKPHVFHQMEEAVDGMSEACRALGVPVVSGNVSLYNETEGVAVLPTPVVGMIGLLEDVERHTTLALREGLVIGLLLNTNSSQTPIPNPRSPIPAESLGASQYVETMTGLKVGRPPALDLEAERSVQAACRTAIRDGLVDVAHDCSEGGLAVALAEMCIAGGVGAQISLDRLGADIEGRVDALLFGEEGSRIVVAFHPDKESAIAHIAGQAGISLVRLGTAQGDNLQVTRDNHKVLRVRVDEARDAWIDGLK